MYVPCDERFRHLKRWDSIGYYRVQAIHRSIIPAVSTAYIFDDLPPEFDSFQDIRSLYENAAESPAIAEMRNATVGEVTGFRTNLPVGGGDNDPRVIKMPLPHVIRKGNNC